MWAPAGDPSNWNPTCWNGSANRRSRPFLRPDTSCAGERRSTASCAAPTRSLWRRPSLPAYPTSASKPSSPTSRRRLSQKRRFGTQNTRTDEVRGLRPDPLRTARRRVVEPAFGDTDLAVVIVVLRLAVYLTGAARDCLSDELPMSSNVQSLDWRRGVTIGAIGRRVAWTEGIDDTVRDGDGGCAN